MKKILGFGVKTSKKGNVSVLLSMIFVSLMMVTVVLVGVSASASGYSYCDGVLQLAGKSILSEYHLALKDNYGLMAFKGYEREVNRKLKFYAEGSFNRDSPGDLIGSSDRLTPIKPTIKKLNCDLSQYSIIESDNFENDILDYMKYPRPFSGKPAGKNPESSGVLINRRIASELPSQGGEGNFFDIKALVEDGFPTLADLTSMNTDKLIVDEYALKHFNCQLESASRLQTFFQNEVEYLLYGKLSDKQNKSCFIRDFKVMRFLLNSAHVYSDMKKMEAATALAAILTGPAAEVTVVMLVEMWALAETGNDAKLLLAGKNVSLYKNSGQWALSLDAARAGGGNEGNYVIPPNEKGWSYKDYLRLFLFFKDRETKLMRMMDLMQINIQGGFDNTFYIKDCYVGLGYNAEINGQEHFYVQKY